MCFWKRGWVFEPTGLNSDFPIPYLTDYVIYDLQVRENFDYIRGIIEGYRKRSYTFYLLRMNVLSGAFLKASQLSVIMVTVVQFIRYILR